MAIDNNAADRRLTKEIHDSLTSGFERYAQTVFDEIVKGINEFVFFNLHLKSP